MTSVERVIIATRIYRPEPAAASLFLGNVSDALVEAGHDVDVITVTPPRPLRGLAARPTPRRILSGEERVRTFPVLRDKNDYVRGYLQYMSFDLPLVFRLLFTRRAAVVFVEPPPTTGVVVRAVCWLRRIPYVYDAADIWSDAAGHATSSQFVVKTLRALERYAMQGATAISTISSGVVERVRELGITTPTTVTGFGADTSVFHYSEQPAKKVFIYAGTFTELHGAQILVDAFALFCTTHTGYRLKFIGNGTDQTGLRAAAERLGVSELVEISEPVPAEKLRPMLSSAAASLATLSPTGGYEYAFTSKIFSALASGCPVIFAGPGPTADFILEAPKHLAIGAATKYDATEIAAAMRHLADNSVTQDMRQKIAQWIQDEHSMIATGRKVREVILRAARSRKAKA